MKKTKKTKYLEASRGQVASDPSVAEPARFPDGGLVRFGWWALLFYLLCGAVLEGLHGFKVGWYLDVGYETRRLMFTLGHAHGTLLALVTIVAGIWRRVASVAYSPSTIWSFRLAAILLPGGFLLGGIGVNGGDPGVGIWLAPLGALALVNAIASVARRC